MNDLVSGAADRARRRRQRCVSSSRHDGPAARDLHGPLLFLTVAAHVFASVIHRPHATALRSSAVPATCGSCAPSRAQRFLHWPPARLHTRTVSTADPDHSHPRAVLTASHILRRGHRLALQNRAAARQVQLTVNHKLTTQARRTFSSCSRSPTS